MLKTSSWFFAAVIGCVASGSTFAASMSGLRKIAEIGCHTGDNTCFVTLEGTAVGPASCNGVSLRWDSSTGPGKNQLTLLTAAYLAGRTVNFYIVDSCYANQTAFPTFGYTVVR